MYLASIRHGESTFYQIRRSCLQPDSNSFYSELVFDLGQHPEKYIELFNNEIPLFDTHLQETIGKYSSDNSEIILEELLWDFLPRQTRDSLSRFARKQYNRPRPLSEAEREQITQTVHTFDRRRLYYLYYGAIDQTRLYRMHEKLCRPLLYKSRDEREFYFRKLERQISPGEYHNYLYAAFNLQRHFDVSYAAFLPEALSFDEVSELMAEAICQLNEDTSFWHGEELHELLPQHLQRYLFMFFDFSPQKRQIENEFVRNFINSHRKFRWPERKPNVSDEKVISLFSEPYAQLQKMERQELTRLYRQRAMQLHPDQGGNPELFVQLTEIYKMLIAGKAQS